MYVNMLHDYFTCIFTNNVKYIPKIYLIAFVLTYVVVHMHNYSCVCSALWFSSHDVDPLDFQQGLATFRTFPF